MKIPLIRARLGDGARMLVVETGGECEFRSKVSMSVLETLEGELR